MPSPDLPAPRIAYDRDGSYGLISRNVGSDRSPYVIQPNALTRLNADDFGGLAVTNEWWNVTASPTSDHFACIVFPTAMEIVAWYGSALAQHSSPTIHGMEIELQSSRDTTNGLDGTWERMAVKSDIEAHLPLGTEGTGILPDDTTTTVAQSNTSDNRMYSNGELVTSGWLYVFGPGRRHVKGMRMFSPRMSSHSAGGFVWANLHLHLYGQPDVDASEDRLIVLDGTTEDPMGDLRWGDIDYRADEVRSIKIQNLSPTFTAEDIEVTLTAGHSAGTPTSLSSLAISLDGTTWDDTLTLGDLSPGAISDEIFVRLDPTDGIIGLRFARIEAEVEVWT